MWRRTLNLILWIGILWRILSAIVCSIKDLSHGLSVILFCLQVLHAKFWKRSPRNDLLSNLLFYFFNNHIRCLNLMPPIQEGGMLVQFLITGCNHCIDFVLIVYMLLLSFLLHSFFDIWNRHLLLQWFAFLFSSLCASGRVSVHDYTFSCWHTNERFICYMFIIVASIGKWLAWTTREKVTWSLCKGSCCLSGRRVGLWNGKKQLVFLCFLSRGCSSLMKYFIRLIIISCYWMRLLFTI